MNIFAKKLFSIQLIVYSVLLPSSTFAQGTLVFRADLNGSHALPPNGSLRSSYGNFELQPGNNFFASIWIVDNELVNSVDIFRSDTATDLGTKILSLRLTTIFPPLEDAGSQNYTLSKTLTASEASDLQGSILVGERIKSVLPCH